MVARASRWLIGMAAALLGLGPELGPTLTRFEYAETHMSSHFRIVLYTDREETARSASRAAFARIAELDAALSDYQPDSELARLCGQAGGPPVRVGADLFDVLARSRAMSERSGGAFDVTVGPVVRLWRRARATARCPPPSDWRKRAPWSAMRRCGSTPRPGRSSS